MRREDGGTAGEREPILPSLRPSVPPSLRDLRGFLVDLDGVVYTGSEVVAGAPEFFALLRERKIPFLLITNNSSRRADQFAERLAGMGIAVRPEEILTSAQATAEFLAGTARRGSSVYVIGEEGLLSCLEAQGFRLVDHERAEYVVVGLDRGFSYRKLTTAIRAVLNGAHFVGPNPDTSLPLEDGISPGAGAFQAAITAVTGVEPVIVAKPAPTMFSIGLRLLGCAPHEAAIIGDRLDTDILGGQRAGLATILVLSGISTSESAAASPIKPDYVLRDLGELAERLKRE